MKVYGSVAGMIAQVNKIDHIANNVANINTISFKEQMSNTKTFTRDMNISEYPEKNLPFEKESSKAQKFILNTFNSLPVESDAFRNIKNGSLIETGNKLDFAFTSDDKFFMMRKQDGTEYLSRDGNFRLNENGILVNNNGDYVLDNTRGLLALEDIAELGVWQTDFKKLKNIGDNGYELPKELGQAIDNPELTYVNGYLEGSNINGVAEMTKLINAQRLLDQLKTVVETQQDMEKKSNTSIGDHQS